MKFPSESIPDERLQSIEYPVVVSPKLDGMRCLTDGKMAHTSALKPIKNLYVQKCLKGEDYEGLDGELIVGSPFAVDEEDDVFKRTSGPIRRASGQPDFKFYVFDDWRFLNENYGVRWVKQVTDYPEIHDIPFVVVIEQRLCHNAEEVIAAFREFEDMGYEGAIIRRLTAPYKEGRCSYREEFGFKKASWAYDEGVIEDAYEQEENQNEKTTNELGLSKRSSHQENKVGKGTLGGFVLRSKLWKDTFRCGTIKGGTLIWRQEMWDKWIADPESIKGQIFKYKYKLVGCIDKPRQPIGIDFRDPDDMTDF